jgi:hypothetical protein
MQDKNVLYQKFGESCYQITRLYHFETKLIPKDKIELPFMSIDTKGQGILYPGFVSNGLSGGIIQTKSSMCTTFNYAGKHRAIGEGYFGTTDEERRSAQLIVDKEYIADFEADLMYYLHTSITHKE